MNKTIKVTTALGSALFGLAFMVTAASAQTTDLVNTGDDVDIEAGTNYEAEIEVKSSNEAYVQQSSYNFANTGKNETDGNIGGGDIRTGTAGVSNDFSVEANQNQTRLNLAGAGSSASTDATITNTGDDLEADLGSDVDVDVDVESENKANVEQSSFNFANTGDNEAKDNIGGGDIRTGNAGIENEFDTKVNANDTRLSGLGSLGSSHSNLDFVNTGDDADIDLGSKFELDVDVESENEARVGQSSYNFANTGDNETKDNIHGGDIRSGNAGIANDFSVQANRNLTNLRLGNLFSGGHNDVDAINTGDHLDIDSGIRVETEVEVESENKSYNYQHTFNGVESGHNEGKDNIGGGDTDSGNAGTWTDFMADMNWNVIEI